ncbi:MAG: 3-phosphoshikimate 1-carboxyvinyltransferase [Rhizobiales bacterium]|nr:3-phosphoshikimate 1-carboxyvinyltransferase [Hyphomicrobiales bacterium]
MAVPMRSQRGRALAGKVRVPGDKSISHRAVIFGALASGVTEVRGLLLGEDVLSTAGAVEALGARIERGADVWRITGRGTGGLSEAAGALDFGNTGTGVRLMMGVLAGHPFPSRLVGDASLSRRPMGRVLEPLTLMGASVDDGRNQLPLTLRGSDDLVAIRYRLPVPSAQVKSAILLAGLHANGRTTVIEAEATRDHTERMLGYFGGEIEVVEAADGRHITVSGGAELAGRSVQVPGDPSSAAFATAAAVLVAGSEIVVEGVLAGPTRTGFYKTLKEMGADVELANPRMEGGEQVADIVARSGPLKGVTVPAERAPSMIDEYPMLACVAAAADGVTRMDGLAELRVKESDRLAATAEGLRRQGVGVAIEGDCLIVEGRGHKGVAGGGLVETEMDHRIAMAFLTLGLASDAPVRVDDVSMIATSFPQFFSLMGSLGATFVEDGPAA